MTKCILAALATFSFLFAPAQATILVAVAPPTQMVNAGSPVTIHVDISGLGGGTALGAFDFNVNFDSNLLSFQSATFGGPVLGDPLDLSHLGINAPLAAPGPGTIELIETSLDPSSLLLSSQAPSFTLATVSLVAVAGGISPVTLALNSLSDANALSLSAATSNASVTVSAIPEPSSWMTILSGCGVLIALARRRARARLLFSRCGMPRMLGILRLVLMMLLTASVLTAGAAPATVTVAKTGTSDIVLCFSGQHQAISRNSEQQGGSYNVTTTVTAKAGDILNNTKGNCVGTYTLAEKNYDEIGACSFVDADGDTFSGQYARHGFSAAGTWNVTAGCRFALKTEPL